ncbi:MAG: alkylglycerone-phosphate synthase [Planctomycetes bacterium]|nr:alkylglycerone-phosphate synthase [Planctomycetota bacterium]
MKRDTALLSVSRADRAAIMNLPVSRNPVTQTDAKLVARLKKLVGAPGVLTTPTQLRPYAYDQCWLSIAAAAAGKPLSRPDVVVRPESAKQVSGILELANHRTIPVTPWGGGSGVQGAANADRGGIVIDLRRMNRVRSIDRTSMTATVEAGTLGLDFEKRLNRRGLTFTHLPASIHVATIGGCLAARGSGVISTKYGKIEDHVLSLEAVLPTGEVINTMAVPRHAMGPELTQLFIGSEGTLGVITAARVKIRTQPEARLFRAFTFRRLADGLAAGREIMVTGLRPAAMRLYDRNSAAKVLAEAVKTAIKPQPTLLMTFEGDHPDLTRLEAGKAGKICRAVRGQDLGALPARQWWDNRYVFYYPPYHPKLPMIWGTVDVVMDYARAMGVYRAMCSALKPLAKKHGLVLTPHFSHWYEWGVMLYARCRVHHPPADYEKAVALHDLYFKTALDAALEAGAVLNDHHGVGVRCAPYMERQLGGSFEVLRRIKSALDPNNIMCPGKLALGQASTRRRKSGSARRRSAR